MCRRQAEAQAVLQPDASPCPVSMNIVSSMLDYDDEYELRRDARWRARSGQWKRGPSMIIRRSHVLLIALIVQFSCLPLVPAPTKNIRPPLLSLFTIKSTPEDIWSVSFSIAPVIDLSSLSIRPTISSVEHLSRSAVLGLIFSVRRCPVFRLSVRGTIMEPGAQ